MKHGICSHKLLLSLLSPSTTSSWGVRNALAMGNGPPRPPPGPGRLLDRDLLMDSRRKELPETGESGSADPSGRLSLSSGSGVQQGKAVASGPQTGRAAGVSSDRSAVPLPLLASPASAGGRGVWRWSREECVPRALPLPWLLCRRNPGHGRHRHSTKKRTSTTSRMAKRTAMAHHWRRSLVM